ncbi:MAG TPA: hypothetical protein VKP65_00800 [Rhodothermales bacterium]|nr:hypothetical protein [Rhodothermales bacterium]
MNRFGTSWCWIAALMLALFGLCPCLTYAQASSSEPSSSGSSLSKTFSFHFPVAERQSISLGTEIMKTASIPKDLAEEVQAKPTWDLKAVPVTLGYSYELADPGKGIVPIVGVGVSYYFCEVKKHRSMDASGSMLYVSSPGTPDAVEKERGMGYGFQATLGLRTEITRHIFVQAQSRTRYVNGFAFMGQHAEDLGMEFTKIDVTLGLGYTF